MSTFTMAWQGEDGGEKRMMCHTLEEAKAWFWGFKNCGWEKRTSLKTIDSKGYTIKNWWEAMSDKNLYNFNTLYLSFNLKDRLRSGFVHLVEE